MDQTLKSPMQTKENTSSKFDLRTTRTYEPYHISGTSITFLANFTKLSKVYCGPYYFFLSLLNHRLNYDFNVCECPGRQYQSLCFCFGLFCLSFSLLTCVLLAFATSFQKENNFLRSYFLFLFSFPQSCH